MAFAAVAAAVLALAGAGCVAAGTEPARNELEPRDLTPVTWLEAPKHPPVEIVRDGKAAAVVYVADPETRAKQSIPRSTGARMQVTAAGAAAAALRAGRVVRLRTGATLESVEEPPAADRPAIVIGDCEETRQAGIDAAKLPPEGFVVKTAPNRVYLVGGGRRTATARPGPWRTSWSGSPACAGTGGRRRRALDPPPGVARHPAGPLHATGRSSADAIPLHR